MIAQSDFQNFGVWELFDLSFSMFGWNCLNYTYVA